MHMFRAGDTIFNFNSDGSGDVRIQRSETVSHGSPDRISVPMEHVLEFVGHFVRSQRIARLEDQNWEDILGIE